MATNELINNKPINLENLSLALSAIKADYTNRIKDNKSLFFVDIFLSTHNNETVFVCSHTKGQCQNAYESGQLVCAFLYGNPLFYVADDSSTSGHFCGIDSTNFSLVSLSFQTNSYDETLLDPMFIPLVTGSYSTEAEMEEMLQEMGFDAPVISNYNDALVEV